MPSKILFCLCVRVCAHEVKGYPGWALSFLNALDNEQMLQKLGKKHRLLPAGLLWPGELAHWRTGAHAGCPLRSSRCCCWGTLRGLARFSCAEPASPCLSLPLLSVSPDCGGEGYDSVGWSGLNSILGSVVFSDIHATFFTPRLNSLDRGA